MLTTRLLPLISKVREKLIKLSNITKVSLGITEKPKEFSETKLYKKATSQVIHGALNNPLRQYCLVFLCFS